MAFTYTDALNEFKTLISSSWNNSNTDSITPTFEKIYDVKRIDVGFGDYVLFYRLNTVPERPYLGNTVVKRDYIISVDIRTKEGFDHLWNMEKEFSRICETNRNYVFSTGEGEIKINSVTELTNRLKKLYRITFDVTITRYVEAIS